MPWRSTGRKPEEATVKEYLPGTRNWTCQLPCSFVLVCCLTSVSSEVTVTSALGTAAPCASVTRPPSVARAPWAQAEEHTRAQAARHNTIRFINSFLPHQKRTDAVSRDFLFRGDSNIHTRRAANDFGVCPL